MTRKAVLWKWVLIALLGVLSAAVGFYLGQLLVRPVLPGDGGNQQQGLSTPGHRPAFTLPDTAGQVRSVREWDGKVLVVNFWATWCSPCREEMPGFVALQAEYEGKGVQFLGIAIDESQAVADYLEAVTVNYPVLLGQLDGIELSRRYGNHWGALPFTAIVDRQGQIVFTKGGTLTREETQQHLVPYL